MSRGKTDPKLLFQQRGEFVRLFEPAWALLEDGLAVTLRDSLLRGYWTDYMASERKGQPHTKHLQASHARCSSIKAKMVGVAALRVAKQLVRSYKSCFLMFNHWWGPLACRATLQLLMQGSGMHIHPHGLRPRTCALRWVADRQQPVCAASRPDVRVDAD